MLHHRILLVCLSLLAFALPVRADDSDGPVTLKSKDGQTKLVLPAGWAEQKSSNPNAAVEGRDEDGDAFVMVIVTDRSDPYMTLDDYTINRRDEVLSHLVDSHVKGPDKMKINGYKAEEYEIHGTSAASKMRFGYFLTVIQMRRHYLEIVGWAPEAHFADNADTLKNAAKNVTYSGDQ